jgi:hypothetical protein
MAGEAKGQSPLPTYHNASPSQFATLREFFVPDTEDSLILLTVGQLVSSNLQSETAQIPHDLNFQQNLCDNLKSLTFYVLSAR